MEAVIVIVIGVTIMVGYALWTLKQWEKKHPKLANDKGIASLPDK